MMEIVQGSDWSASIVWTDEDGNPQSATGATISCCLMMILTHREIMQVTVSWTNDAAGEARISMDETQTALVPIGFLSELTCRVVSASGETSIFTGGGIIGLPGCIGEGTTTEPDVGVLTLGGEALTLGGEELTLGV